MAMIQLELPPEVEAGLAAQAQAEGLGLVDYVASKLALIARRASSEQWERELDQMFDELPQGPALPDSALHRDDWYPDRS